MDALLRPIRAGWHAIRREPVLATLFLVGGVGQIVLARAGQ